MEIVSDCRRKFLATLT